MAISVKKITLWRGEFDNRPGELGKVLAPLADAGADLQVVMGYHYGAGGRAAIEVFPVTGKKAKTAAEDAGLDANTSIPTLLVEGDNCAGLGAAIAEAIADAGINISFLVAQVIGQRFSATIGFDDDEAAKTATSLIKKAAKKCSA